MFGFGKNKVVEFVTDDLDACIESLSTQTTISERQHKSTQIANTIYHYLSQIHAREVTEDAVFEHFKRQKNAAMSTFGREFYKNSDAGATYICWCFFLFVKSRDLEASKNGINKILVFCESFCDPAARSAVIQITSSLRKDFKIFVLKVDRPSTPNHSEPNITNEQNKGEADGGYRNRGQGRKESVVKVNLTTKPQATVEKVVVLCPACRQKCRVPKDKVVEVTCPSCQCKWTEPVGVEAEDILREQPEQQPFSSTYRNEGQGRKEVVGSTKKMPIAREESAPDTTQWPFPQPKP